MKHPNEILAVLLAVLLCLVACAEDAPRPALSTDSVADGPRVAAVDWSKAETVTVALSNFHFRPAKLEFRRDMPYRLHLRNESNGTHTFTSEGFFRANAVLKLQADSTNTVASSLKEIKLAPREEKDLYFVAVKPGSYELICAEFLHDTFGMTGQIVVR